jgi:hypothetical protein
MTQSPHKLIYYNLSKYKELKHKAEAIELEKYRIFKSKCKDADTFALASDRILNIPMPQINPNSYVEFNDYVQSIYESRNPYTLTH